MLDIRFLFLAAIVAAPMHAQSVTKTSIIDEIGNIPKPMITLRCAGWYEASTNWLNSVKRNPEYASEALQWSIELEKFGAQQLTGTSGPDKEALDLAAKLTYEFRDLYLFKIRQNVELHDSELGKDGVLDSDMRFCSRIVKSTIERGSSKN